VSLSVLVNEWFCRSASGWVRYDLANELVSGSKNVLRSRCVR
jgi:hypothetical protein